MSAPTPEQEDEALASLSGTSVPSGVSRDILRLDLIGQARENGVTWAAIGASLGMNAKAAKASAKRLARDTRRGMVAPAAAVPREYPDLDYIPIAPARQPRSPRRR